MFSTRLIAFLILGTLFAVVHWFALTASLYWYYWWFDIVMHFWGGALVVLGWYNLVVFPRVYAYIHPTLPRVLLFLCIVTVSWEVFEYVTDLWQPAAYWSDTFQDIMCGFVGGLLAYFWLRRDTIK